MMYLVTYECWADRDIVEFLRNKCQLKFDSEHSFGQGNVVGTVERGKAWLGIIDEDRNKSHHGARERATLIISMDYVDLYRLDKRFLVVVKPALEKAFLASMSRVNLHSEFPSDARAMKHMLNYPRSPWHTVFVKELGNLYESSRAFSVATLLTDLEACVRKALAM